MNDLENRFRAKAHSLILPRDDDDKINRYVAKHSGEEQNYEHRPFRRQVDFWAFCIATALARDLEPRDGHIKQWGKPFVFTSQNIMNNDLCGLLTIIAVAKLGHEHPDVAQTGRVVELANRLAAAGCPFVLKRFLDNPLRTTPLDQALELARSLLEKTHFEN